ncbi:polyphosphate polymerase domain-containing protein [Butyrivibrio sp. MC2021]|uniref:polyphosphate polymerase domain-containing protein n=1 Tax=Butyrivibrio sp. MC2021 TaxID=1408306 RepID=UPI00047E9A1F|nr:polyphosphate polymerase domain-containing protein [Butyrivibrio sp. MC2021]
MSFKEKYRHEYKYPISDLEAAVLKERIRRLMSLDSHVGESGMYHISSLYFDDYYDSCYYENENGSDLKEKFRIRIYDNSTDMISLECKRKEHGKTLKMSCRLQKSQVEDIIEGRSVKNTNNDSLLNKFIILQNTKGLKPKVIVDYKRMPYIERAGNVRITFDSQLASSKNIEKFLDGNFVSRPILPVGMLLMEVKYDEFLPDFIYDALQLNYLTQSAFSKYYLCRKFCS